MYVAPQQSFDLKSAYNSIRVGNLQAETNLKGLEFYDLLLKEYGQEAILGFLKKVRPMRKFHIDLEPKHLASEENVIFSGLEEAYYPRKHKELFKFLDFKIWGLVGLGFLMESSFHIFDMFIGGLP